MAVRQMPEAERVQATMTLSKIYLDNYLRFTYKFPNEMDNYYNSIFLQDKQMINYLRVNSKAFVIGEKEIKLLSPQLTKNKLSYRRMPFSSLLILNDIQIADLIIKGLLLLDVYNDGDVTDRDIQISTFVPVLDDNFSGDVGICFNLLSKKGHITNDKLMDDKYEYLIKQIKIFVCNFLDFLNDPHVETVTVERSEEQNHIRISKSKPPIPTTNHIRVTGQLKIYLDKLESSGHINYSHRFWVRGHFRVLRNVRYKENIGRKIWVPPFIKGQGILLNKRYIVGEQQ